MILLKEKKDPMKGIRFGWYLTGSSLFYNLFWWNNKGWQGDGAMHIYFTMSVLPVISTKYKVIYMLILSLYKKEAKIPDFCQRKRLYTSLLPANYSSTWIVVSFTDSTPFWDMSRSANVLISAPSPCTKITSRQRSWVTCEYHCWQNEHSDEVEGKKCAFQLSDNRIAGSQGSRW